jgi:hypothetical protein
VTRSRKWKEAFSFLCPVSFLSPGTGVTKEKEAEVRGFRLRRVGWERGRPART